MGEIYTAEITTDGEQKIVRLPEQICLEGTVSIFQNKRSGEVTLRPASDTARADAWAIFLDDMSHRPRDPEFMRERPLNRPPVERKLFAEE